MLYFKLSLPVSSGNVKKRETFNKSVNNMVFSALGDSYTLTSLSFFFLEMESDFLKIVNCFKFMTYTFSS